MKFLNACGDVAEKEGHHPDLHITEWNNVEVVLYTFTAGGLTMCDFIVAAKLDAIPVKVVEKRAVH